jgi:hypothetical protein
MQVSAHVTAVYNLEIDLPEGASDSEVWQATAAEVSKRLANGWQPDSTYWMVTDENGEEIAQ